MKKAISIILLFIVALGAKAQVLIIPDVHGRTQLRNKPAIIKHAADLDCRKAFILTAKGKIVAVK